MDGQCSFIKASGERCRGSATGQHGLCWAHDPKNAERRRRGQSRGGKNKPSRELIDIKKRLSSLASDVLEGEVDRGTAAVTSQVLNVYLRALSVEIKLKEVDELARELEDLRALVETRKEDNRWGLGIS